MDPIETTDAAEQVDVAQDQTTVEAPLVDADLLVEDVSIDGMCGVY
ncbi:unannotated protein [freshwater metagenome]|uniref:Unannotated protein n=1 Tax=freshwater metagenome TaxID=449393 RepID=A0A6J7G985_9ZZZZ|nr:mycofactocin precursor [Actinomycetota bacterium]